MGFLDVLNDLRERNEKQFTQFAAELLNNERFADAVVRVLEMATDARNQVDGRIQSTYRSFNLPAREEFEELGEKVKGLSKILSDLDNRISRLSRRLDEQCKSGEEAATLRAELDTKEKELKAKDRELKQKEKEIARLSAQAPAGGEGA